MMPSIVRPPVTEEFFRRIADRIVERFDPHQVILFGSYASGHPGPDSDVDLFVVMDSVEPLFRRAASVRKVAQVEPIAMDIIVRTPAEVEERLRIGDTFVAEVLEKGRVLYDRRINS